MALEVTKLSVRSPNPFGTALKEVSFAVQKGEILGIAGVAGNGQDELLLALSGELQTREGRGEDRRRGLWRHWGRTSGGGRAGGGARGTAGPCGRPRHEPDRECAAVRGDPQGAGEERLHRLGGDAGFRRADRHSDYDVRTPGIWVAARALSGGNLQKFVVGRELSQNPGVVVVNQPTWGVDAAAAAAIRQALIDRAAEGAAVVVISQDLDELLEIADRFAALNGGRLTAPRPVQGLTVDEIGLMMGGAHGMEVAHHAA